MKLINLSLTILLLTIIFGCGKNKEKMDLIIYNAVIYSVDHNFSIQESAAIKDGKFVATGTSREILNRYSAKTKIDLNGKFVYPGLIDPHAHFYGYGSDLMNANLAGIRSYEEVIEIVKKHNDDFHTEWVQGRGWDQTLWPDQAFPHKQQLDQVFPDQPVLLIRVDGHAAIANTEALKRANIKTNTTVDGGEVISENGELTGLLIDNAINLVRAQIPPPTHDEMVAALLNAQENCFKVGLTGIGDCGLDLSIILMMDSLHKTGDLKMRLYPMLNPNDENFNYFFSRGIYKTDHINVRSVKLYADGALGSRGARMIDPYSDDPANYGLILTDYETIREVSQRAYMHGFQVNTHCIGDDANRQILNIYGDILQETNDRRWRIEHAQVIHPDDFDLFGKYSVIPSVQTTHATSDMRWAEERLGHERVKGAYAFKDLLNQNGWLPNGSDFPVEDINPLLGFYAGVSRQDLNGFPSGGFQSENRLTREEALKAMTIWAAKSQFEEDEKGSVEPGKFADFIVTNEDLMTMDISGVPEMKIFMTYVGGELVYSEKK